MTTYRPWSCDSFVALPGATRSGSMLFAKNSDRPAGEVQPLRREAARPAGEPLRLAYVTIDDAPAFAHVGSAPFWCWGYEIGVNEHRVAIGNEAVFTRPWADAVARERRGEGPETGLLGMELLRLGLERGDTARGALGVMTALLEQHGQWGSAIAGMAHADGAYDNSFLIADPHEAWVLETVGREWAARRVRGGTDAISNELTTRTDADLTSAGLADLAAAHGWTDREASLDVADAFTDPQTPLQVSHIRRRRAQQLLAASADAGGVGVEDAQAILRDHLESSFLGGPTFDAARPDFHTLCMHEHPSGFTWGNTAASFVVELHDDPARPVVIWWCAVTPCTGAYLPVFVDADLPPGAGTPACAGDPDPRGHAQPAYDPASSWWQWQHLLDVVKDDAARSFPARAARVRAVLDPLERAWRDGLPESAAPAVLAAYAARCHQQARAARAGLLAEMGAGTDVDDARPLDPRWRGTTG